MHPEPDPTFRAQVEARFDEAAELSAAERVRWFERRAADTAPEVLDRVRRLLEAHDRGSPILDEGLSRLHLPPPERPAPPRPVGPYRLLGEIGRGGMSVVYRAERADGQFRSRVAIKFLRGDIDAEELHARLAAERQILAGLDHPNIARLLDGGLTDEGRPYLVMEYVEGRPVTTYALEAGLSVEARLALFLEIAGAVRHAHARLVIHRDLKPSNILVTREGRVRLLDFGIAKVLDQGAMGFARGEAPQTRTGMRLFTPEYASPEQVRGEAGATSNDVWALGVLLHELLTGTRPFDLDGCTPREAERRILEDDPPRPSQVVGAPADRRRLQGDLDRIVAMALRKDPARRYPSVERLAEDVELHLAGLPVRAQPDRVSYRVGKFLRRHRVESAAAALVFLTAMGGLAGALWQAAEARAERDRAELAATRSEAAAAYLLDLFQAADPWQLPADRLSARELLARGVDRLEELPGDPLLRSRLLLGIGQTYLQLGDFRAARPLLEEALALRSAALGDHDLLTGEARLAMADLHRRSGELPEAEAVALRVLDDRRASSTGAVPAADRMDHARGEAAALSLLGFIRTGLGRTDEAREAFEAELTLYRRVGLGDAPEVGHALINVAAVHRRQARYPEAEGFLREALEHRTTHLGPEHPLTAVAMARLAGLLSEHLGRTEEAADFFTAALELQTRVLGEDHPSRIEPIGGLAMIREAHGDMEGAEALIRESFRIHELGLGAGHPTTMAAAEGLAAFLGRRGRLAAADSIFRATLAARRTDFGDGSPGVAGALTGHASVLLAMGRHDEAAAALEESIRIRQRVYGAEHALVGLALADLARVAAARGDRGGEVELLARAHAILERFHPPGHPETVALAERLASIGG
jgi:eukaryotic-like serine/threonine-protein kinase